MYIKNNVKIRYHFFTAQTKVFILNGKIWLLQLYFPLSSLYLFIKICKDLHYNFFLLSHDLITSSSSYFLFYFYYTVRVLINIYACFEIGTSYGLKNERKDLGF
jgi:hypothetical protein